MKYVLSKTSAPSGNEMLWGFNASRDNFAIHLNILHKEYLLHLLIIVIMLVWKENDSCLIKIKLNTGSEYLYRIICH